MSLARTHSIALVGVEGHAVEIEADIENELPGLLLVGLPDTALREARDRIRAAIVNSKEEWPNRRITVGLSPASLPKRGSSFDVMMGCERPSQDPGQHQQRRGDHTIAPPRMAGSRQPAPHTDALRTVHERRFSHLRAV